MTTMGLQRGQLNELLERVNNILIQNNLPTTTKPNLSHHLRKLDKPSQTLTGNIIKKEAKVMIEENEAELQAAMNKRSNSES
jgi:hypothetical protein